MDVYTQAGMTAEVTARVIDAGAEWRDARWWCACPLCGDPEKRVTIWQGIGGPVIRCGCGCSTDRLRTWTAERQRLGEKTGSAA
jgi:hypothetical protein